jgi:threonine/homoserine/homoserine lactone efflux protein
MVSGLRGAGLADAPFRTLPGLFVSSLLVGFSGALMPGPLLAAVVAGVAAGGVWTAPALVTGHALLELLVVVAVARGLGRVLRRPGVTRAIAAVGGLVLLWLAWNMIADGLAQRVVAEGTAAPPTPHASVLVGALVSGSNPYWLLWWATAGASYVALALSRGASGLVAFYFGHVLSDYSWYAAVALAVAGGRRVLGPAVYNATAVVAGGFLAIMALLFLRAAIRSRPAPAATDL